MTEKILSNVDEDIMKNKKGETWSLLRYLRSSFNSTDNHAAGSVRFDIYMDLGMVAEQ